MAKDRIEAGDDIDAWCGRCQLDLAHTVVAVVDGWPAKLVCRTCGAQHAYKKPKRLPEHPALRRHPRRAARARGQGRAPSAPALALARRATGGPKAPARVSGTLWNEWREREPEAVAAAQSYSPRRTYGEGIWIRHLRFGLGRVTSVRGDKIDVLFQDGERVLVHGR